jgi:hypothetical protein
VFSDELRENVVDIGNNGKCSTHPKIDNGRHARAGYNRTVIWCKIKVLVMRNREQPRPFLGSGLLRRYQWQPWNGAADLKTQYTWDGKKGLCSRAGGRVIAKTIEKQGKVDANKKKAGSSAGVRGSRRKR